MLGAFVRAARILIYQLNADALRVIIGSVHPGVCAELLHRWSRVAVIAKKFEDEILEGWAQAMAVNLCKISVDFALHKQLVKEFLLAGLLEWEDALHDDEKDDTEGE